MTIDQLTKQFAASLPQIRFMGTMLFDPIWAQRDHPASTCELVHVIKGRMNCWIEGKCFRAGPGDTLLIPHRACHRDEFDLSEGLKVFFCAFSWRLADEYFRLVDNAALLRLPAPRKAEISRLIDQLRADLVHHGAGAQLVARSRVLTLLLLALREAAPGVGPAPATNTRHQLMRQAKSYLEAHYAEPVALADVAAALSVSGYYLSHVFHEESEFSLFEYLTAFRVEKAKTLLGEGRLSVKEVARAVGFENPNYFAKVFRKLCGCSPSRFRRTIVVPQR